MTNQPGPEALDAQWRAAARFKELQQRCWGYVHQTKPYLGFQWRSGKEAQDCSKCYGLGYVPNVSLEAVVALALRHGGIDFHRLGKDTYEATIYENIDEWVLDKPGAEYYESGFCNSPTEAALGALMATTEERDVEPISEEA